MSDREAADEALKERAADLDSSKTQKRAQTGELYYDYPSPGWLLDEASNQIYSFHHHKSRHTATGTGVIAVMWLSLRFAHESKQIFELQLEAVMNSGFEVIYVQHGSQVNCDLQLREPFDPKDALMADSIARLESRAKVLIDRFLANPAWAPSSLKDKVDLNSKALEVMRAVLQQYPDVTVIATTDYSWCGGEGDKSKSLWVTWEDDERNGHSWTCSFSAKMREELGYFTRNCLDAIAKHPPPVK